MPEQKLERIEHVNMCKFIDEAEGHKMLEKVKNGDIIVCRDSGYTFIWDNHYITGNRIINYNNYECNLENVVLVKKQGYIMLEKTLEFLKKQTGLDFKVRHAIIKCGELEVYNVVDKNCVITYNKKINLTQNRELIRWEWVKMEPSEFIDKIAKGEWV